MEYMYTDSIFFYL